jgi:hypothetical protein
VGTSPGGFEPWARHGWLAAGLAALVVVGSAVALAMAGAAHNDGQRAALDLAAMTAAAILAAPVGWYHYQLCQFPAFALVIAPCLAAHRWRAAALLLALQAALTRAPAWGFGLYVERFGWTARSPAALWLATSVGPILAVVWTIFLIREARRAARLSRGRPVRAA